MSMNPRIGMAAGKISATEHTCGCTWVHVDCIADAEHRYPIV